MDEEKYKKDLIEIGDERELVAINLINLLIETKQVKPKSSRDVEMKSLLMDFIRKDIKNYIEESDTILRDLRHLIYYQDYSEPINNTIKNEICRIEHALEVLNTAEDRDEFIYEL